MAVSTRAKTPGEVVTSPAQLGIGDVIAVIDRERLLQNLPPLVGLIAVLSHHNTVEARLAHAGISKAGPGDPSHFHGTFDYADAPTEADGEAPNPTTILISTESDAIHVAQYGNGEPLDIPANPLYVYSHRV